MTVRNLQTQVVFAHYQREYSKAYIARDQARTRVYAYLIKQMFIAIACGYEFV